MDTQNIINVDIDSRAVTLPVNFNLGVMYDNSCKTITFMVKKKSDITDLTDLTFSINTISAKGTPDKLECTCQEEGGFYIITAVLKGAIFEASGKATFNLCGQKFDSSHVAVKAWGSEDITALVGEHSHADKAIEELYPSVLEELKQKVNNPNLTDEQLDKIATKIAEKGFYTKTEIDSMIAGIVVPTRLSELADDAEHRTVTDNEKEKWNKPSIIVDTELSDTSENPVQNKAITNAFINFEDNVDLHLNNIRTELDTKADKTALDSKVDKSSVDTALNENSNNPIANKTVATKLKEILQGLSEQLGTKANTTDIPTKLAQLADDTTHRLVTDEEKAKWNKPSITVDTEPNADSNNPIANSAFYNAFSKVGDNIDALSENITTLGTILDDKADKTALDSKVDKSSVDTALSSTSTNPVQNKIIKDELDKKANTTDLGVKKVTHTASDTNVTINSGEYHVFPTMQSLTITPGTVGADKMFICGFEFTSGSTPTSLTLTGCTLSNSDDVTTGTYEVNILGTSAIVRSR